MNLECPTYRLLRVLFKMSLLLLSSSMIRLLRIRRLDNLNWLPLTEILVHRTLNLSKKSILLLDLLQDTQERLMSRRKISRQTYVMEASWKKTEKVCSQMRMLEEETEIAMMIDAPE